MRFSSPKAGSTFTVDATPTWPTITFATDQTGAHDWSWKIEWRNFHKSGKAKTADGTLTLGAEIEDLGGTLTVTARTAKGHATVSVSIVGTNPSESDVQAFLTTRSDSDGFFAIIRHETHARQFRANGEPIKSFDNGYGMCQLTSPAPSYAQVWNWKKNVEAGLTLFGAKRVAAKNFLSAGERSYTVDQLKYETVSRWNGGSYHKWDAKASAWARKPNILCDSATGNIGWNMDEAQNKGKTEAELHKRDVKSYRGPPGKDAHWGYYGVCYADAILATEGPALRMP